MLGSVYRLTARGDPRMENPLTAAAGLLFPISIEV